MELDQKITFLVVEVNIWVKNVFVRMFFFSICFSMD